MKTDIILNMDCLAGLRDLPSDSVDLVFADPPYNLQLSGQLTRPDQSIVEGVNNSWDQFDSFKAYDHFSEQWLSECHRVLKQDGAIWVIGSYHNIFRLGKTLQDIGFWILNDVVWRKTNPMPNFRGRRFTNAHETLIWAAKSPKSKYQFNYDSMKMLNEDLQMRSDWSLPICNGQERLKDAQGKKVHPTQKPENLLSRVIIATSKPGDIILDPFFGTGTTGAVAKRLGRRYIGIEQDATYVKNAERRLSKITQAENNLVDLKEKRDLPRVPFGALLERGWIKAGDVLFDQKNKFSAKVRADGSLLTTDKKSGSIHAVGAQLQGSASCNGWSFWYLDSTDGPISIDSLRDDLRKEMH
ncbi:DNA methyltransferase [Alphaproteobacteria bacterium]|nr:DNA methyltransferase [Alphaproteobacteria bacterium]